MSADVRVTRVRQTAPDPSIARAVGRHHTFETAIADLVDNSLDAGATRVLIRFLEKDGAVTGLQVIDDGRGMDSDQIDAAMEYARRRTYDSADQGHFGLGLKAASLSQANRLNVYSRRYGALPAGRTIDADDPTRIGDLDHDDVTGVLGGLRIDFPLTNGTVVEWEGPRTFLSSRDQRDRSDWLEQRIAALKTHLGIVFHRQIQSGSIALAIDVFDAFYGESGAPRRVTALDPFGYRRLPNDRFPAALCYSIDGSSGVAEAHVWPASQAGLPEFRLGGRPGGLAQGFYFYRNNRLLQMGGWNTLAVDRPELEYVRISVDIDGSLAGHVTINPEKAGLELDADAKSALLDARLATDDTPLRSFLAEAEMLRRDSRRYEKRPVELVQPARGMSASMRIAFDESVERADADPFDIRWRVDPTESPVHIDLEQRTIWLNSAYRALLTGVDGADNEDAPLLKTLLAIIYSRYFEGSYLGSREKAELQAWDQLLTAAVREESARQEKEIRDDDAER
ncbi:ATP-binding protein [Microbacterium dauci]|uniref:ATP-binding protein n=1 Tax=Microbacterium dauci TaxID=3048008 RepID=A0ABT6ZB62_9MICO|nr:ATP-binding protein [Microbacterium sp. LX3-4]MDJ1113392.1 ATP-binding protein [Microbacterium sp. LX3-4]